MIPNKSGRPVIEARGGGGGGGGGTCQYIIKKIEETSKEKHSLTRKLVEYRNWRQRWCKEEENEVLRNETKILYLALLWLLHVHVLNIGFLSHYLFS